MRAAFGEALTVAMLVAPGVYARNRMFEFFSGAAAQRARRRAAILRGVVPQLLRATMVSVASETHGDGVRFVLRYTIAAIRLSRVVDLTPPELAALRIVATKAGVRTLPVDEGDRALVEASLAELLTHEPASAEIVRRVRESAAPSAE